MTHTNKLFFLAEDNWEIMFGHYIFFLEHLQRCIFYSIAVIFSKWYRISFATDDNRILGLQAKSVLPIWLFTKYQYNHFTLEILLLICTSLIGPMTYFYQHLWPGALAILYTKRLHSTFGLLCPNWLCSMRSILYFVFDSFDSLFQVH